jgi:hypothetical protein
MKLLTADLKKKLTKAGYANMKPICKLFTPWGNATWLITSIDEDGILYGWAQLFPDVNPEWGGIATVEELEAIRGPFGLKIERDLYWTPPEKEVEYWKLESLMGV